MNLKPTYSIPDGKSRCGKIGFTLFALLAAIAIVVVIITMGAIGIRYFTTRKDTSRSLPNADAVFAQARATAIGHGVKSRVMLDCVDNKDTANYKRRILNAVQTTDENGKVDGNN